MNESDIQEHLYTKFFGRKVFTFDSIDSTNNYAKYLTQDKFIVGTLIISDEQTSGRGRQGRRWLTEKGTNLTFSVIIKPNISSEKLGVISLYAGLAVAEAIQDQIDIKPECKWPNDILLNHKKCCGILSESVFDQNKLRAVIIGIGLNVNQVNFPDEIIEIATSLSLVTGITLNRFKILSAILLRLESLYKDIQDNQGDIIIERWIQYCNHINKQISIIQQGKTIKGIAKGLAKDGGLIIQTDGIEMNIYDGDVTIIK